MIGGNPGWFWTPTIPDGGLSVGSQSFAANTPNMSYGENLPGHPAGDITWMYQLGYRNPGLSQFNGRAL